MELKDFPRPPQDNRRGIHWSASIYHPEGEDLRFWINELKEMNIKWVKLLDDGGGSSLKVCEALLAEGIMPVVRLYRHRPNPGHIGGREVETVKNLVALGVRYFETNNEPNLSCEWQNDYLPPNWLEIVAENLIIDADIILSLGGLPAIPAVSVGTKADIFSEIAKRRPDLFNAGIWAAIHNYTLNHPIDYPYDPVNQEGKPLTLEEYLSYGPVDWVWDYHPLELINEWREKDKNPGATVMDDPSCFLAFEWANALIVRACGHSIPIISTEGGPVVGWRDDRRYPRVTPALHRDMVLAIDDYMQRQAPPYYFAMCHWLIANYKIGHLNPVWESQAWYTDWWNDLFGLKGELPVVQALKERPALLPKPQPEPQPAPTKVFVQVFYFGSLENPLAEVNLQIAFRKWVYRRSAFTFSLKEASRAKRVNIVGTKDIVSEAEEQALKEAGCKVRRYDYDPYELNRR